MTSLLVPFTAALALSLALVPASRAAARRLGYVAQPRTDRWHGTPTPLLGGVAIALSVAAGLLLFGDMREQAPLVFCALTMFAVGLVDDLISLKPSTRLVAQIVLASVLIFFDYQLGWVESLTLDRVLTVVWIVGITNAFNLLDNMDGLCAGIALIAGAVSLASLSGADPGAAGLFEVQYLALLLGAVAGFLVYNIHPASVFMGDSGSLFIGMSFAGLTLGLGGDATAGGSSILSTVAVPVLVLLIPILDTTLVTVSRIFSGRSAALGGRDHTSHRLVAIGLSERGAVMVLWWLAAIAGFGAWAVSAMDDSWSILVVAAVVLGMAVFAAYLARVRVYEDADADALRQARVTPLLVTFMHKRRVLEVLLDGCLIVTAYYAAYRLRFEGTQFALSFGLFLDSLPVVLAAQFVALFVMGAYRGVWRHFALIDSVTFVKAVALGTVLAQLTILYLYRFESYSRTVFIVYAALLLLFLLGSRASFRLIGELASRNRHQTHRLIVYGAGEGGAIVVRELLANPRFDYRMMGFIDDDPVRRRVRVQGYPVLGPYERLREQVTAGAVDSIVISTRAIDPARIDEIEGLCRVHGVRLLRLQFELEDVILSRGPRLVALAEAPPRRP